MVIRANNYFSLKNFYFAIFCKFRTRACCSFFLKIEIVQFFHLNIMVDAFGGLNNFLKNFKIVLCDDSEDNWKLFKLKYVLK